jgi:hypothetical protein
MAFEAWVRFHYVQEDHCRVLDRCCDPGGRGSSTASTSVPLANRPLRYPQASQAVRSAHPPTPALTEEALAMVLTNPQFR